ADSLVGIDWMLSSVRDAPIRTPNGSRFEIKDDGTFATTVGCNQMGGKAKLASNDLTFGSVAATQMACEASLMDLEIAYGLALSATRSYRIDGSGLAFLDGAGNVVATFTRRT